MKKLFLLTFVSVFVFTSCGEEEIIVSGPKWVATKKADVVTDTGRPTNVGSSGLGGGWGWGWAASAKSSSKSSFKDHTTADDCYTRIDGKIYNLTPVIQEFPELSDKLESMCGEETTKYYNSKLVTNNNLVVAIKSNEVTE